MLENIMSMNLETALLYRPLRRVLSMRIWCVLCAYLSIYYAQKDIISLFSRPKPQRMMCLGLECRGLVCKCLYHLS